MKFVCYASIAFGALMAVVAFRDAFDRHANWTRVACTMAEGCLGIIVGMWVGRAARHFDTIVITRGHDIENLMAALRELKKVFELQRALFVGAVAIAAVAFFTNLLG